MEKINSTLREGTFDGYENKIYKGFAKRFRPIAND